MNTGDEEIEKAAAPESPPTYDVGYGKPPAHTRFRKGQSGNPRGRPKGSRSLVNRLDWMLGEQVSVQQNGMPRTMRKGEAVLHALVARAARGDTAAARLILTVTTEAEERERAREERLAARPKSDLEQMSEEDLIARLRQIDRDLRSRGYDMFGRDTEPGEGE